MVKFNPVYFSLAILLFAVEVLIALYVRDRLIRPYGGDVLVVILIYCFVRSFIRAPALPVAFSVLVFAFAIEFLQYFQFIDRIGWGDSRLARVVLGHSFSVKDLLAYCLGIALVIGVERIILRRSSED